MTKNSVLVHGWNSDDFASRCGDNSSELMENMDVADRIGAGARQLLEDNTCIIELRDNRVSKLVCQRDPEYVKFEDPEDKDEGERPSDSEDAMDHVEERVPASPRIPWDVVRWLEPRKEVDGTTVMVEMSAPVFPRLADRRPRGVAAQLERLIKSHKLEGRGLYVTIQTYERDGRLNRQQVARLWELYKIEQFVRKDNSSLEAAIKNCCK